MDAGKFTREDLQQCVDLVKTAQLRFDGSGGPFRPKPGEWIILMKSAPTLDEVFARVLIVGALGLQVKSLGEVAVATKRENVLSFERRIIDLLRSRRADVFADPALAEGLSCFSVIRQCRGLAIRGVPVILDNFSLCLPKQDTVADLAGILRRASGVWVERFKAEWFSVKDFFMQGESPPLFGSRVLLNGQSMKDLALAVAQTPFGLRGGSAAELLQELVDQKVVSQSMEELLRHVRARADKRSAMPDPTKTIFTPDALASDPEEKRRRVFSRASRQLLDKKNLQALVQFFSIRNACNLFRKNINFTQPDTVLQIRNLVKKLGSVRELVLQMAIIQMQNHKVNKFKDLEPLVQSTEVKMFKQQVQDVLQNPDIFSTKKRSSIRVTLPPEDEAAGDAGADAEDSAGAESPDPEADEPAVDVPMTDACKEWKSAVREEDQKIYYWNTRTGKRRWKKPRPLRERDAAIEEAKKARAERVQKRREAAAARKREAAEMRKTRAASAAAAREAKIIELRRQAAAEEVSAAMAADVVYAGRLRTKAIIPVLTFGLEDAPTEAKFSDFKQLTEYVEKKVGDVLDRETKETIAVLDWFKRKKILTHSVQLRITQIARLVRASLFTEFGMQGGKATEILDELHAASSRYRLFNELVTAVQNAAIQKTSLAPEALLVPSDDAKREDVMTMGEPGAEEEATFTLGPATAGGDGDAGDNAFVIGPQAGAGSESVVGDAAAAQDTVFTIQPMQPTEAETPATTAQGGDDDAKATEEAVFTIGPAAEKDEKASLVINPIAAGTGAGTDGTRDRAASAASSASRATSARRKMTSRVNKGKIKWKKVKELGRGAFGVVIWGIDTRTGQSIAIKQIRLKSKHDEAKVQEVAREVRTLKKLSHPNIVELYEVDHDGYKLNIIMEYVPSNSIDWVIKKIGKLDEHYMARVTAQVLEALRYCHGLGIIHRDIKGKNILVDNFGNVKLADFGSALLQTDTKMQKENTEYTPLWAAPEMVKGEGKYSTKVDVWSLGCTIVEMASGKEPWSECNFANPFMALFSIGKSDKIPKIPDEMSEQGHDFVLKCLTRDPEQRWSAEQLQEHPWVRNALDQEDTDDEEEGDDEDIFKAPTIDEDD